MNHCERNGIPFALILGEEELKKGIVKVKDCRNRDDKGTDVPKEKVVEELKSRLSASASSSAPAPLAAPVSAPSSSLPPSSTFTLRYAFQVKSVSPCSLSFPFLSFPFEFLKKG